MVVQTFRHLSAINNRYQGLAEKICKTHAIVLAKLIKLRVRSDLKRALDWI
jgi:predicted transcriptional regulator